METEEISDESTFLNHLRSQLVALEEETDRERASAALKEQVRELAIDTVEQFEEIEMERAAADSIIKALIHRMCELKTRINQVHSSFISRLPPETVVEIFQWNIAPFTDERGQKRFSSTPLFLGTICSTWRKIAWATPALWTSLTLRILPSSTYSKIKVMENWLLRTGDLPLSIRLISEQDYQWRAPNAELALEVMETCAPRWSNLDLRIPTYCHEFLLPLEESLPLLKSLRLSSTGPGRAQSSEYAIDISDSVQPQSLGVTLCPSHRYLFGMTFPLDRITHLQLLGPSCSLPFDLDDCLEVMSRTPRLVSCTLITISPTSMSTRNTPILLPSLTTLNVNFKKETPALGAFLGKFSFPSLQHFSYSGIYFTDCAPICAFMSDCSKLQTFYLRAVRNRGEIEHHCIIASMQMKGPPGIYSVP